MYLCPGGDITLKRRTWGGIACLRAGTQQVIAALRVQKERAFDVIKHVWHLSAIDTCRKAGSVVMTLN